MENFKFDLIADGDIFFSNNPILENKENKIKFFHNEIAAIESKIAAIKLELNSYYGNPKNYSVKQMNSKYSLMKTLKDNLSKKLKKLSDEISNELESTDNKIQENKDWKEVNSLIKDKKNNNYIKTKYVKNPLDISKLERRDLIKFTYKTRVGYGQKRIQPGDSEHWIYITQNKSFLIFENKNKIGIVYKKDIVNQNLTGIVRYDIQPNCKYKKYVIGAYNMTMSYSKPNEIKPSYLRSIFYPNKGCYHLCLENKNLKKWRNSII